MSNQPISTLLIDDNRAVSEVIGVVILFGFLILALSLYQVEVVPQQNAETEFQHSEDVRNDLVELRAGILQAGAIDQPQYQTVQLGTTYSTRVFAINPPAPAGTIRTTDSYPITISNNSETITIPTRFIEYRPGYNELDRSPTWYDASVLYLDARDEGGGIAVVEDQTLVNGGEVQITALQNEFRRSATGQVTLELRPADNVTGEIPEGDLTVTVPTRLSEDDWETKTNLPTDSDVYGGVTDTDDDIDNRNIYNLTLNTTANNLTVDTVGVQATPEDPTQNDAARVGSNGNDGGGTGDSTPPQFTSGPSANPNTVGQGTTFDLTATLDDTSRGGTDIISVTWSDDQGNSGTLSASDGEFDQPKEAVEGSISTDGWSGGDHILTVTGTDGNGNTVSDTTTVTIETGDSLPADAVAFDDTNGNGVYDGGETTYENIGDFDDDSVDLVIERGVSRNGGIDISARSVIGRSGVTIESPQNDVSITATSGNLDLSGTIIRAGKTNQEKDIELDAESGDINLKNTTLQANGDIEATPGENNKLIVNNSENGGTGTIIEDRNGDPADLSLNEGTLSGEPEKGNIIDET